MRRQLTRKKGPLHIDGKQPIKFCFIDVSNVFADADAGVIHQNIEPAKMFNGLIEKSLNIYKFGDIRVQRNGVTAGSINFSCNFFSAVCVADIGDRNRDTLAA